MAKPQLYKTGNAYGTPGSPLIMERGRTYPHTDRTEPNQITAESGAGYLYTVTNGRAHDFFTFQFEKISDTQIQNIKGFLSDPTVNWKAKTFYFVDENSVAHEVNYFSDTFNRDYRKPTDEQNFSITFRKAN